MKLFEGIQHLGRILRKPRGKPVEIVEFENAPPRMTDEMRLQGFKWRKTAKGDWLMVCAMCGSNCGQCGNTDRLGNFNQEGDAWADKQSLMSNLVRNIGG